jgi:hypothetical protein
MALDGVVAPNFAMDRRVIKHGGEKLWLETMRKVSTAATGPFTIIIVDVRSKILVLPLLGCHAKNSGPDVAKP